MAQVLLRTVASVAAKHSLLAAVRDESTSSYQLRYESTFCPVPGADPERIRQEFERRAQEIDATLEIWKRIADRDESGFVTTREASETKSLIEFGCLAAGVLANEPPSITNVARATAQSDSLAAVKVSQYEQFLTHAHELGLHTEGLPKLSFPPNAQNGGFVTPKPISEAWRTVPPDIWDNRP